jgi:hypothetical protein
MLDVEDTIGAYINGSLDLWTFISYSQTAPNYNPLWFAQPTRTPSSGNTSYVGAQFGMVLKAGRTKGRVVFNELGIAQPPYRGAPANPDSTNPQIWDKVAKWYLRDGYFTLRDGSRATVSFKPSGEYNKKLLKMRNLR